LDNNPSCFIHRAHRAWVQSFIFHFFKKLNKSFPTLTPPQKQKLQNPQNPPKTLIHPPKIQLLTQNPKKKYLHEAGSKPNRVLYLIPPWYKGDKGGSPSLPQQTKTPPCTKKKGTGLIEFMRHPMIVSSAFLKTNKRLAFRKRSMLFEGSINPKLIETSSYFLRASQSHWIINTMQP